MEVSQKNAWLKEISILKIGLQTFEGKIYLEVRGGVVDAVYTDTNAQAEVVMIDYDNIEEAKPWTHGKTTYLRQFNYLWTNEGVWVGAWDGKKIDKTAKEPAAEME